MPGNEETRKMNKALWKAADEGLVEVVNRLLQCQGMDVNAQDEFGKTAMMWASENGYDGLAVINRLLKCKEIDVNAQNSNGETALMVAALNGYCDVVNRLLDGKDINVNMEDRVRCGRFLCTQEGD